MMITKIEFLEKLNSLLDETLGVGSWDYTFETDYGALFINLNMPSEVFKSAGEEEEEEED